MKKIIAVLIVVYLGIAFLSFMTGNDVLAEDTVTKCNAVRTALKNKFTNGNLDALIADEKKQGLISVYLSESIQKNYGISCSQIISCMRTANITAGEGEKRIGSSVQEMVIIKALRDEYPACIIEGKDGLNLLSNYAAQVYKWISGIVGAICILTIVFSGIQISIGGLSQEEVSGAKDRISRALIGMVVLFLSAFILYTINPIFFT